MRYIGEPTRDDLRESNIAHQAVFDQIGAAVGPHGRPDARARDHS